MAYSFPPPYSDISQYRIYAAKLHPELATDDNELVVSQCTDTHSRLRLPSLLLLLLLLLLFTLPSACLDFSTPVTAVL